jgi:hypothetical protein
MKTLEEIVEYKSEALDGRDITRLAQFFSLEQLEKAGFTIKEEFKEEYKPKEYTEEAVMAEFKGDVEFGFTKALNQRGLSASMMNEVIKMWLWVLNDETHDTEAYAQYGLPLLKSAAVKYGFYNEIGDDDGDESKYAA